MICWYLPLLFNCLDIGWSFSDWTLMFLLVGLGTWVRFTLTTGLCLNVCTSLLLLIFFNGVNWAVLLARLNYFILLLFMLSSIFRSLLYDFSFSMLSLAYMTTFVSFISSNMSFLFFYFIPMVHLKSFNKFFSSQTSPSNLSFFIEPLILNLFDSFLLSIPLFEALKLSPVFNLSSALSFSSVLYYSFFFFIGIFIKLWI